jgi:predicted metal-dependent hydrolase
MSLDYKIVFSKRRSISVSVNQTLEVVVKAPKNAHKNYIEAFVLKNRKWIVSKINLLKMNKKSGFWWLGSPSQPPLQPVKPVLITIFEERLEVCYQIFKLHYNAPKPRLVLRKMKSRWGSMSSTGRMTLNTILIHTPIECIDYVIFHELCHIKHQNHGRGFYEMQAKMVPNYKAVQEKLKEFLIRDFYELNYF